MPSISQLPAEQRPREILAQRGAGALSDAELLAIFLRTGIEGESAIEIGKKLLIKHGSLANLGKLDAKQIAQEKGIGLAKASQLLACFELGARVAKERLAKRSLSDPAEIADFLKAILSHRRTETLLVLAVDGKLNLIHFEEVSQGGVNSTIAHPREILRPVIMHQAAGFLLAHNHPSGDPAPSRADLNITREVEKAAKLMRVTFHDHLIIGNETSSHKAYYSFKERGLLHN